jgi:DNA-binding response OmpR family regulator
MLIVDDNKEFRLFLKSNFEDLFNVFPAENGISGLQVLQNQRIDIIIGDIMMPEMSGLEMCRIIRKDVRISHIPVILLTAKTDTNTKIEGLETGADVYIEKPFSMQYLNAQVNSLLKNRENLRELFSNTPFAPLSSITETQTDKELLKRINEVVEKNIANTEFSVDDIADSVNMSRSVLYIKIKAVVGLTPNDFIRLIRLKKAAEYLSTGDYRINEVCYLTGFSSPSYFSKCFQKQFGVLPKDFVN